MGSLAKVEESAASRSVRRTLREFRKRMGTPQTPNLLLAQAASAASVRATWQVLENVVLGGVLPRVLKELILAAVAAKRGCRYCRAVHTAVLKTLGADRDTVLAAVENLDDVVPMRTGHVLAFAVKCATEPDALTDADYHTLRQHGVSDEELTEVIATAAAGVYLNIIADASKVELDEMFERDAAWLETEPAASLSLGS